MEPRHLDGIGRKLQRELESTTKAPLTPAILALLVRLKEVEVEAERQRVHRV